MVEQKGGLDCSLNDVISKCSGSRCDISFRDLSKSAHYEIGEPFFIGCVHPCL